MSHSINVRVCSSGMEVKLENVKMTAKRAQTEVEVHEAAERDDTRGRHGGGRVLVRREDRGALDVLRSDQGDSHLPSSLPLLLGWLLNARQ